MIVDVVGGSWTLNKVKFVYKINDVNTYIVRCNRSFLIAQIFLIGFLFIFI